MEKMLPNGYKIVSDESNFILQRMVIRKKKETEESYEAWETVGYYSDILSLMNAMAKKEMTIAESDVDFFNRIQDLYKAIDELSKSKGVSGYARKYTDIESLLPKTPKTKKKG